jgi:GAF domain-containing protein/ABC-type uncharacterized transport system substrate-binding protein
MVLVLTLLAPGGDRAPLTGAASLTAQAQEPAQKKSVLVLHSYHVGYKWTDDITAGIVDGLGDHRAEIDLQIEYMDTKRIYDEDYVQYLYETYRYKFRNRDFDVIISSDDNAFNFLLDYGDEIFPGTPVVFCGVNYYDPARMEGGDSLRGRVTGVNEEADLRSTLELALGLHPETRLVAVVNDTTTTGLKMRQELEKVIPAFRDRTQFIFLEALTMEEVQDALGELPANSLVLYTLFFRDKAGVFYEYDESIRAVVEASSVPVYATWDFSLGYGPIGGMLTSGYYQGETAARLVVRILDGEDVAEIPVVMESPNRYMFDYEVLQGRDISLASLPVSSVFINRPSSFYERYQGWIWGGGSVFLALVSIILALVWINLRRRRAEAALRVSNLALEEARSSLEQRVAERTVALDRRSSQLEAAADVAREAAGIREPGILLDKVVRLISERMGFYHAGIFMIDEQRRFARLRAASSEGGQRMLERGHELPVGGRSIVGYAAGTGRARIALDVGQDAVFFDNPDLPDTRSEMALPLVVRERVIGVLDVQSVEAAAFSEEDVAVLQTLSDQVALAIENARLLEEAQDRLREIAGLVGERSVAGWREVVKEDAQGGRAYTYDGLEVRAGAPSQEGGAFRASLQVQDQTVGHLDLAMEDRPLSREEAELVQDVARRISQALERARLFQESQQRAAHEALVGEIRDDIRAAVSVEDALGRALRQMGQALGAAEVVARLGTAAELLDGGDGAGQADNEGEPEDKGEPAEADRGNGDG